MASMKRIAQLKHSFSKIFLLRSRLIWLPKEVTVRWRLMAIYPYSKQPTPNSEANAAHTYEQHLTPRQLAKAGLHKQLLSSRQGAVLLHCAKGNINEMGVEPT